MSCPASEHQSKGWADTDTDWVWLDGPNWQQLHWMVDRHPFPYCSTPCMAGRAPPPPADTPAPAACRAAAGAGPHTKRCSPIPPGRALGAGLQRGLSRLLGARESERKGPFGESKQAGLMGEPFQPRCLVSAGRQNPTPIQASPASASLWPLHHQWQLITISMPGRPLPSMHN